ncbi:MAG: hypothetical protein KGQ67_04725 [Betaproteobacteria bacterium]|nr:hypothetical protein [Betaproteobacteria bacterium]
MPGPLPALAALALSAGGGWMALHHPLSANLALAGFIAWTALCLWRPLIGLSGALALLPLAGLAPWTGWLALEELDLLLAGLAIAGLLRGSGTMPAAAPAGAGSRLAPGDRGLLPALLIGAFGVASAIALARGWLAAPAAPLHWTQGYLEPLNSLRLARPFAWTLLLLPLMASAARERAPALREALADGMLTGLALACLAALWERMAFPGLLNFSADYRTSALFWEMHVGGAALDGYLALGVPFAVRAVLRARTPLRLALSGAVAMLAAYACLTTFSRGVYLAIPIGLVVMALVERRAGAALPLGGPRPRPGEDDRPLGLRWLAVAAPLAAAGTYLVFAHGGYRASGAALAMVAAIAFAGGAARRLGAPRSLAAIAGGALFAAALGLVAAHLPKGPYLLQALLIGASAALTWRRQALPERERSQASAALMMALIGALGAGAGAVALHWGGPAALSGALPVLLGLGLLAALDGARPKPLWPTAVRPATQALAMVAITSACVAVFTGGSYMGERFSDSGRDLRGRLSHWQESLAMMRGPIDWALGKGLGRYHAGQFFGRPADERPGSHAWRPLDDRGDGQLTLTGPGHVAGWGELYRFSQRVPALPGQWQVNARVRPSGALRLHVEICAKHLLYDAGCSTGSQVLQPPFGAWQTVSLRTDGSVTQSGPRGVPTLAMFSIAVATAGARLEIDELRIIAPDGREISRNPGFLGGLDGWFFSSDRHHLPWHAKNLGLHLLIEQGAIGGVAFALLTIGALARLARRDAGPMAGTLAGALSGFLVVGLFDSLLDAPRVAWTFYLLTAWALLAPRAVRPRAPQMRDESA